MICGVRSPLLCVIESCVVIFVTRDGDGFPKLAREVERLTSSNPKGLPAMNGKGKG